MKSVVVVTDSSATVPPDLVRELNIRVGQGFVLLDELYVTELTPVMGAHTGPRVLGIVFYTE